MAINLPAPKKELTSEFFSKYFWYDEKTGNLVWKPRDISLFPNEHQMKVWHSRYAFKEAGTESCPVNGYRKIQITLARNTFSAHRVIAIMSGMIDFYGDKRDIDHIDGDPFNNRIQNLRVVSRAINMRNRAHRRSSTGRVHGVNYHKQSRKWQACIGKGVGKSKLIGYFDDWFDAVCARKSAEIGLGYTKRHWESYKN